MKNNSKSSDCSTSKVNKRLTNCKPTNNEGTAKNGKILEKT